MAKKIYVLDTSVCLTDAGSILSFANNDIILPLKVLEEIDNHKKRQDSVGSNAREIIRKLDALREKGSLYKGVRLGKGKGVIYVKLCRKDDSLDGLNLHIPDNEIIGVALNQKQDNPKRKVVVVTRDINMRVKCDALGLATEDYQSNHVVKDTSYMYTGFIEYLVDEPVLDRLYNEEDVYIEKDELVLMPNQFIMLVSNQNEKKTALARFFSYSQPLKRINGKHKSATWGVKPRNKEQMFALDLLKDCDVPVVTLVGKAGSGKAQPLDSKILTPTGWKKMGEISVGDMIINRLGKSSIVAGVFPQGKKDVYKVSFSDGTSTEACKEHLWLTRTQKNRDLGRKGSVKSLEEIINSLRIGKQNKRNHSIPVVRPIEFESKEKLLLDPYLLGSLLGDGCISVGIPTFSTKDTTTITLLQNILDRYDCEINKIPNSNCDYRIINKAKNTSHGGGISRRIRSVNITNGQEKIYNSAKEVKQSGYDYTNVWRVFSGKQKQYKGFLWERLDEDKESNNPIKNILLKEGLWGKRSYEKEIPEKYKFSSVENRLNMLRGLMDADGFVSRNGMQTSFCSISKKLAYDVAFLVRSFGGKAVISSRITNYPYNGKKRNGQKSYRVRISLGEGFNPFLLARKAKRWKPNKSVNLRKYIDTVEYVGQKMTQCIYIDDEEHLYVTDDLIVTHNTLLAIAAGLQQIMDTGKYKRLIISRPIQPMGRDIGFLPGSIEEKMAPWVAPIQDNLKFLMGNDKETLQMYVSNGTIEVEALTYIRGRSVSNAFIIIDEAQNLTTHELKTIITRVGENTKIVLTGDIEQIDNMYIDETSNGLTHAVEKFKTYDVAGHITLIKGERSKVATLAAKIF